MRRFLALLVLAGAIVAAVVLTAASSPVGPVATYKIEFDNIFGLTEGGDLTIAGIQAGKTPKFELTDDEHPKALVTAEISKPGFTPFRADAHCDIRQQSLIGTYYVSCQPGRSPRKLRNGAVIPVEQTTSTIPIDLVNDIMRRPYKERFRILLTELGTGVAGRPQDIAEVLQRAHPGLRETSKTLRILGDQNKTIKRFIADSDVDVRELERNKEDVARFVREAGQTAEIAATRQNDIRRGFRRLPRFLGELRPTMARLGEFSDAQIPTLIDLKKAAPDLRRFLVESEPFARTTRPVLRSLGRTGRTGIRAFNASDEEIRQLRQVAAPLPQRGSAPNQQGLVRPLRQFLVSLDDRHRSTEEDLRARQTAPPSPDPTAYTRGQGFTGFESFFNVNMNLTLAVNIFDDVGHYLRILGITDKDCSPYRNIASAEDQKCASYLGRYQPCVGGKRQPVPSIFNRREICGGKTHGGGATASSGGGPNDSKQGKPEEAAVSPPAKPTGKPAPRAAANAAPTAKSQAPADRRAKPESAPVGARSAAPEGAPASSPDKDRQLMDYFLGQ